MRKLRVPIPSNRSKELLDLATKMLHKHLSDAEASKLSLLDWQQLQPIIEKAAQRHSCTTKLRTLKH